ncbi:MAG TPA: protein-tyrosine-phosphatase, partial [Verrucomicrobiae bacterium]|nr:protein-tyrosine-phosphatase [Verrucomicrobiae bacterium]
ERKRTLQEAAQFIRQRLDAGKPAQLTFVCTHNSRRSHLAQIWTKTAAAYYGLTNIQPASGGTEVTACNIRTVKTLRRAGFSIADSTGGTNPVYIAQITESGPGLRLFSKVYSHPDNPQKDFAVLMCCDQADAGCPFVPGAVARFAIHYVDPKATDNTEAESATYDERSRQIAREMFYMISQVRAVTTAKR